MFLFNLHHFNSNENTVFKFTILLVLEVLKNPPTKEKFALKLLRNTKTTFFKLLLNSDDDK